MCRGMNGVECLDHLLLTVKSGLIYTTRSSSITSFLPGQSIEKRKAEAKGKAKCKAKSKGKKKSVKEEEPKQVESHFAALLDKDYGDEDADDEDVDGSAMDDDDIEDNTEP